MNSEISSTPDYGKTRSVMDKLECTIVILNLNHAEYLNELIRYIFSDEWNSSDSRSLFLLFNQSFYSIDGISEETSKRHPIRTSASWDGLLTPAKYITMIKTAMLTACGGVENFLRIIFCLGYKLSQNYILSWI